mmetsp:Transcript_45494/g.33266  ORF Transcript_45494/g.33266 Transcript_45494/m.33266 type:complete len:109 (+) Transcript_45494:723-1049(+)
MVQDKFDIKVVTFCLASPSEVAAALLDEKNRQKWDPDLVKVSKVARDTLEAEYSYAGVPTIERIQYKFLYDEANCNCIIVELTNQGQFVYYEISQVQGKGHNIRLVKY